jgi:polyhydroxybutyrate depolymerase
MSRASTASDPRRQEELMFRLMPVVLSLSLISCNMGSAGTRDQNTSAPASEKGQGAHVLQVKGAEREYYLHAPPSVQGGAKVPLMVVLHGGMGNAQSIETTTGMNDVADREGFFVAYPEGTEGGMAKMQGHRTWNAGACCGAAVKRNVDDVGFISAMIDDIAAKNPVDVKRVYVTGMSNGAMMAYRMACDAPQKVAAVIAVSGTLSVNDASKAKDVPVLHIHGTKDTNVPFEGGIGDKSVSGVEHRSVADTMTMLLAPRKSTGSKKEELGTGVEHTTYEVSAGAPVELMVIEGGPHAWPGGRGKGGSASDLKASQQAWDFAKRFSKQG